MGLAMLAVMGFAPTALYAQDAKPQDQKPAETKKEEPKKDSKTLDFEKAVRDLKKIDGPFTFYQRKKEILLELPEDKIGKIFLIQAALNTGGSSLGLQAGDPLGSEAVDAYRWDRNEDQIWLVRPNTRYRWVVTSARVT